VFIGGEVSKEKGKWKRKMEKTMNFEHRMNATSKGDWMIKK
jgi:hypothetical protein